MTANRKRRSERLLARMSRLAQEKSNLQLVNNLMCSLGGIAGLDNIVDRMLHLLSDQLGGHNIALYYALENTKFYADVFGEKHVVEKIDDEMVRRAFETGLPVEETRSFEDTGMLTREFTRASYCALPLKIREHLIGVIKMDGMLLAIDQMAGKLAFRRDLGPYPGFGLAIEALDGPVGLGKKTRQIREDRVFPGHFGHSNHSASSTGYEICVT